MQLVRLIESHRDRHSRDSLIGPSAGHPFLDGSDFSGGLGLVSGGELLLQPTAEPTGSHGALVP